MSGEPHWSSAIVNLSACQDGCQWAAANPDLLTTWERCERGDWLLWLAARLATTDPRRREVVRVVCAVARRAFSYVVANEKLRGASETLAVTEEWAVGKTGSADVVLSSVALHAQRRLILSDLLASAVAAAADYSALAALAANDAAAHSELQLRWTKAATRPAAWVARTASLAAGGSVPAAEQSLRESAALVRQLLPATRALAPMLESDNIRR